MSVEEAEARIEVVDETKKVARKRKCLMCASIFDSAWAGERICKRCKATAAWRGS